MGVSKHGIRSAVASEQETLGNQLAKETARRQMLEETLRDTKKRLRNLSTNLVSIHEAERKALAREIHDELGQLLVTIQLAVSLLAREYSDCSPLVATVAEIEALIVNGIKTVQRITTELRPAILDLLGLSDALDWQSREFCKRTGIECKATILLLQNSVDAEVATALFRIYQEALTNVQHHAQATVAELLLTEKRGYYSLTVRDNGRGITAAEVAAPDSIGLIGIRERVLNLGGSMKIYGAPQRGTTLVVRVPVKPRGDGA